MTSAFVVPCVAMVSGVNSHTVLGTYSDPASGFGGWNAKGQSSFGYLAREQMEMD